MAKISDQTTTGAIRGLSDHYFVRQIIFNYLLASHGYGMGP